MQGQSDLFAAAMGIRTPTWYDRHRANWERTGDVLELGRMVRHVTIRDRETVID